MSESTTAAEPGDEQGVAWRDRFSTAMMGSAPAPLTLLERGEGCYVWDVDGKKYLDFLAGIAVNSLGHGHPALVEAVSRQVATLAHGSASSGFATTAWRFAIIETWPRRSRKPIYSGRSRVSREPLHVKQSRSVFGRARRS